MTIQQFQTEAQKGADPAIKQFAATTLPTLRTHLALAQQNLNALGGP
jgi:hypothetical protein